MASLKRIWTLSLACGALLACGQAAAQGAAKATAPGTSAEEPVDISGDHAEQIANEHKTIFYSGPLGHVEVVQKGSRLVCDTLTVYSYGPGEGPNAAKPPADKAAQADSGNGIKQMIAEGHVFYVTQDETVRGDHGVYDAAPDIITMTGNVIAVQGKNVARGDRMVMDRKTGQTTMYADAAGRNNPNRVRGVFYNQSNQGQTQPAPAKKP